MAIQPIDVVISEDRRVTVQGDARYTGTRTSGPGASNIETYDVVIDGIEVEGTWDNDGRHNVEVYATPALREVIRRDRDSKREARDAREMQEIEAKRQRDQAKVERDAQWYATRQDDYRRQIDQAIDGMPGNLDRILARRKSWGGYGDPEADAIAYLFRDSIMAIRQMSDERIRQGIAGRSK